MTELMVSLDFACVACEKTVGVTVQCAGPNLAAAGRVVASVAVPCPHCSGINELYFEPSGTIHAVTPCGKWRVPEPSLN